MARQIKSGYLFACLLAGSVTVTSCGGDDGGGTRSPSAKSDVPPTDFSADSYLWSFFNP